MPMHDPPHPGESVRYECLEPLGLSVTRQRRVWASPDGPVRSAGRSITASELESLVTVRANAGCRLGGA